MFTGVLWTLCNSLCNSVGNSDVRPRSIDIHPGAAEFSPRNPGGRFSPPPADGENDPPPRRGGGAGGRRGGGINLKCIRSLTFVFTR